MSDAPAPLPTESTALVVGKALVLNAAVWLTLRSMAGEVAILAGVLAATLAVLLARLADRRGLRAFTGAVIGLVAAAIALPVGHFVLDSTVLFGWLDSRATLIASDVLGFGLLVGGLVFALRLLAARSRGWSLLEAAAVLGAVAHFFARHRNQMIHRPLFLSDWALSHGLDPQVVLQALGVVAAAVAVLMALRRQRALKLAISLATLLLLGWLVYQFVKDMRIEVEPVVDAAQQQDDDADSKDGKSGGDGKGSNSGGGGAGNALGDGSGGGTPPPRARSRSPSSTTITTRRTACSTSASRCSASSTAPSSSPTAAAASTPTSSPRFPPTRPSKRSTARCPPSTCACPPRCSCWSTTRSRSR